MEALADGITNHSYISQLEAGKIDSPGLELLSRIADRLSVPVSFLTGEHDQQEDPRLTRLLDNYRALDAEAQEKLLEDSAWLRRMTERARPAKREREG